MNMNVGSLDRRVRLIAGVILVLLPFIVGIESGALRILSLVVGVVLLATAALNRCPAYSILGINTRHES